MKGFGSRGTPAAHRLLIVGGWSTPLCRRSIKLHSTYLIATLESFGIVSRNKLNIYIYKSEWFPVTSGITAVQ